MHEAIGNTVSAIAAGYAGGKGLAGVAGSHLALPLRAVEREGVSSDLLAPEGSSNRTCKSSACRCRSSARSSMPSLRAHEAARHLAAYTYPCTSTSAIGPSANLPSAWKHRVVRIFPALVRQPSLGCACVLDESVAIEIALLVDPGQRTLDRRPQLADQHVVAGALRVKAGEHDKQRRRVDAPIVEAEGYLPQRRHLAAPHLMQDLAGSASLRASSRLAWWRASRFSTPAATAGSIHKICRAVTIPSRPKLVEYQGMPA
jgi:hypothetical protein